MCTSKFDFWDVCEACGFVFALRVQYRYLSTCSGTIGACLPYHVERDYDVSETKLPVLSENQSRNTRSRESEIMFDYYPITEIDNECIESAKREDKALEIPPRRSMSEYILFSVFVYNAAIAAMLCVFLSLCGIFFLSSPSPSFDPDYSGPIAVVSTVMLGSFIARLLLVRLVVRLYVTFFSPVVPFESRKGWQPLLYTKAEVPTGDVRMKEPPSHSDNNNCQRMMKLYECILYSLSEYLALIIAATGAIIMPLTLACGVAEVCVILEYFWNNEFLSFFPELILQCQRNAHFLVSGSIGLVSSSFVVLFIFFLCFISFFLIIDLPVEEGSSAENQWSDSNNNCPRKSDNIYEYLVVSLFVYLASIIGALVGALIMSLMLVCGMAEVCVVLGFLFQNDSIPFSLLFPALTWGNDHHFYEF